MKNYIYSLLLLFLINTGTSFAQLNGFKYRTEFEVTEISGVGKVDFQILLRINTKMLLDNGLINVGAKDLRFSGDCDGSVLFDYFIEDAVPGIATKIWVKIPAIIANSTSSFYMFYGNKAVPAGSDFELTFPLATRFDPILWNLGLQTGTDFSWAEIPNDITLKRGAALQINARRIKVNGDIFGNGQGELRGLSTTAGAGPGGGTAGASGNGGGGGGHGNNGGAGNAGIAGGISYDTFDSDTAYMGSGGGAGGLAEGGNGGGAILFNARLVEIYSNIHLNGNDGNQGSESVAAGGGGAGGGALIKGKEIIMTGNISANGGNSGQTFSNSNGGGGAGGRIKLFYEDVLNMTGAYAVLGGDPGILAGGYGGNGTTFEGTYVSGEPIVNTLGTIPFFINLSSSATNDSICAGDATSIIAPSGFANYDFVQVGVGTVQSGPSSSYTSTSFNNGDKFYVTANVPGCSTSALSDTITVYVVDKTVANFTASGTELTWNFTNTSSGPIEAYMWDFDDGTTSTDVNPTHDYAGAGFYDVTLTTYGVLPCATSTRTIRIRVICTTPSPAFSYVAVEQDVTFNNESVNADSYRWFSPNDSTFGDTAFHQVHHFPKAGTYVVCLEVKNDCQTITLCKNVTVTCIPPTANFTIITDELNVTLQNNSVKHSSQFWYSNEFSSYFENESYTYSDRGTYNICLIAKNECSSDTTCKSVTVNCSPPVTNFSYTKSNSTCRFSDLTNNAVSWLWTFGDGTSSTEQNPFHVYDVIDDYLVCLRAVNACGDFFTRCDNVVVTSLSTGIEEHLVQLEGTIFPNPVGDMLHVNFNQPINDAVMVQVHDIAGKLIAQVQTNTIENELDLSELQSGVYMVSVTGNEVYWTQQFLKQ